MKIHGMGSRPSLSIKSETYCLGLCQLMSPNEDDLAVHGWPCRGDLVVLMRKVMAIQQSWCFSAETGIGDYLACKMAHLCLFRKRFCRHHARKSEPARGLLIFQFRPFLCVDTIQQEQSKCKHNDRKLHVQMLYSNASEVTFPHARGRQNSTWASSHKWTCSQARGNQLAIHKRGRGSKLETTESKSSRWLEWDSNPGPPNCEPKTLSTRPRCLLQRRVCEAPGKMPSAIGALS